MGTFGEHSRSNNFHSVPPFQAWGILATLPVCPLSSIYRAGSACPNIVADEGSAVSLHMHIEAPRSANGRHFTSITSTAHVRRGRCVTHSLFPSLVQGRTDFHTYIDQETAFGIIAKLARARTLSRLPCRWTKPTGYRSYCWRSLNNCLHISCWHSCCRDVTEAFMCWPRNCRRSVFDRPDRVCMWWQPPNLPIISDTATEACGAYSICCTCLLEAALGRDMYVLTEDMPLARCALCGVVRVIRMDLTSATYRLHQGLELDLVNLLPTLRTLQICIRSLEDLRSLRLHSQLELLAVETAVCFSHHAEVSRSGQKLQGV